MSVFLLYNIRIKKSTYTKKDNKQVMKITVKQVSSMEKIMPNVPNNYRTIDRKTIMKGESFSYQITIHSQNNGEFTTEVVSPLSDNVKLYSVKNTEPFT